MKKSIRNVLCFSMIVFCMFIGGMVLNVDAEESSLSDTGYTVTIPSEVSVNMDSLSGTLPISVTTTDEFSDNYKELNVKVSSASSYQLKNTSDNNYSIPYTITNDTLSFFSSSDEVEKSFELSVSSDVLNEKISDGLVSGTYTDTLTFNISGTKNSYFLDLNGTVDNEDVQDGGDFPGVATVNTFINGNQVGTGNVGWWNSYEAGTEFKFVVSYDTKKYKLDRVENSKGNLATNYGMTVDIDNDNGTATIEGVISSQNAITTYDSGANYTTRVDLCFMPKTYNLTLDYYKLAMDGATSYESTKHGEAITRYKKTITDVAYGSDISSYLPSDLTTDKAEDYGVVFLGWYTIDQSSSGWESLESSNRASTTMPAPDSGDTVTLYTWWTKTIYLDLNGRIEGETMPENGDMSGFATADVYINGSIGGDDGYGRSSGSDITDYYLKCAYGNEYKVEPKAKSGFTYVGIDTENNPLKAKAKGTLDKNDAKHIKSNQVNQWAVQVNLLFRRNTFTVQFDSNDGEGEMSDQSFSYGKAQNLNKCAFTKSGYTFVGWSTSENGTDTIADQSDGSTLTTTDGGTVTLYAKWEEDTSSSDTESDEEGIALTSIDEESISVLSESDDVVLTDSINEVVEDVSEVEQTEN